MTRLIVGDEAERDLDDLLAYLVSEAGVRTAENYARRFRRSIEQLMQFPGSGMLRPALGSSARIAIVYPYVIIYDHDAAKDSVTVLRIVHGRRSLTMRLLRGRK